jgi:hypothetical protein
MYREHPKKYGNLKRIIWILDAYDIFSPDQIIFDEDPLVKYEPKITSQSNILARQIFSISSL